MGLSLLGTTGVITMDDFVLDWHNSFAFQNPDIKTGFIHRRGMALRRDFIFIETPLDASADVLMIDRFAELAILGDGLAAKSFAEASLQTQSYLDAIWEALKS